MSNKITFEDFLEKAKEVHGENYEYVAETYVNTKTPMKIICPKHGEFWQRPSKHLSGQGCPKCSKKVFDKESFITNARMIHGDKYDYSKVVYVSYKTKVCIICPIHGEFWQSPHDHLSGNGCKKCSKKYIPTTEEWVNCALKVHDNFYSYPRALYKSSKTKIIITCPIHGDFKQIPKHHLNGSGCPKCSGKIKLTNEEFIEKAMKIHGDKYDYSKVKYVNAHTKVCIICPIHGEFWITPNDHLNGGGCPRCAKNGKSFKPLELIQENDLLNMDAFQILELIAADIFPKSFKKLAFSDNGSDKRKNSIQRLKEMYSDGDEGDIETQIDKDIEDEENAFIERTEGKNSGGNDSKKDSEPKLPSLIAKELLDYDKNLISFGNKGKAIAEYEFQKIWNSVLTDDEYGNTNTIDELKKIYSDGGEWLHYVIDTFFDELNTVSNIKEDSDYRFPNKPTLMQKLMVHRLLNQHFYGNWCGTGAGKTNAFLLASRLTNSKINVIIAPNSVIETWSDSIKAIYPTNSNVIMYDNYCGIGSLDDNTFNYILINYDKYNQKTTKLLIESLLNTNKIDFICFDELHKSKRRSDEDASQRNRNVLEFRLKAEEINPNIRVCGMTATPIINNLIEVKSLLELIIGKKFEDIGNRNTLSNIHIAHKNLLLNGFRYIPQYGIDVETKEISIDGNDLRDTLLTFKNKDINDIESLFIDRKMDSVKPYLKKGTIIYTHFIKGLLPLITEKLDEFGCKYDTYTGESDAFERSETKKRFINGDIDVLVASSPISTGVDGLQKICNNMIIISLPWTSADYAQLLGRINRRGSEFKHVDIIIPQVELTDGKGELWSWDKKRYNIITNKKTLSDAVIDGVFGDMFHLNMSEFVTAAIETLKNGKIVDYEVERPSLTLNENTCTVYDIQPSRATNQVEIVA